MTLYQQITSTLKSFPTSGSSQDHAWVAHYLGTNKHVYGIRSADIKKLARQFFKLINSSAEYYSLIDLLYSNGQSYEELAIAATLFDLGKKFRPEFKLEMLSTWLNYTCGWAEVDSLCQSAFVANDLLSDWPNWSQFLIKLSNSSNIHHRRASIVLLNKPLRTSDNSKIFDLSLRLVDSLKSEKDILITKAISWVLRSSVKYHSVALKKYLDSNQSSLPKIALRETYKKLLTGKKT